MVIFMHCFSVTRALTLILHNARSLSSEKTVALRFVLVATAEVGVHIFAVINVNLLPCYVLQFY